MIKIEGTFELTDRNIFVILISVLNGQQYIVKEGCLFTSEFLTYSHVIKQIEFVRRNGEEYFGLCIKYSDKIQLDELRNIPENSFISL
jgi:hypothetical protein